jgi:hypothetical protein
VGDDAVAIKSGIDYAGRQFGRPSENMLFRNNVFASKHVSIGSEESGGVRNITITDCVLGEKANDDDSADDGSSSSSSSSKRQMQVDPFPNKASGTWAGVHLKVRIQRLRLSARFEAKRKRRFLCQDQLRTAIGKQVLTICCGGAGGAWSWRVHQRHHLEEPERCWTCDGTSVRLNVLLGRTKCDQRQRHASLWRHHTGEYRGA